MVSTPLKNIRQLGLLFPIYGKNNETTNQVCITLYYSLPYLYNYSNTVDPKAIGIASGTVPCMFSKPELADGVYVDFVILWALYYVVCLRPQMSIHFQQNYE